MDLKPVDLSVPETTENVSIEFTHDNFKSLNTEVEFLKKENSTLMTELEELRKKKEVTIHKYETNIVETIAGPDEATLAKIRELEGKLIEAEKSLAFKTQEFEKEIQCRDSTNFELLAQVTELKSKEPTYRGTIEILTREKDFYSLKFDETKTERDALLFEKDMLSKSFEDLNIRFTELQLSYDKTLSEFHQSQITIASFESENKLLQDSLLSKQDENKALLLRIADLEDARIQVENLKMQISAISAERDQFASAINLKDYEIAGLKNQLEKYASDIAAKKDVIGHITQAEEVLASDVNELRKEIQKRDKLIETLVIQQNELKTHELKFNDTVKILEAEKAHLLEEAEKLRIEVQCLRVEQERTIAERDSLQYTITQKDLQITGLMADFTRIATENKELLDLIAELERKRDSILIVLGDRESEIRKLKDSIEIYQSEIQFFQEKTALLESENKRLLDLTKAQEAEISSLRTQIQLIPQLQSRIRELETIVSELQSHLAPFDKMKMELAYLQTQNADLISRNNALNESLQERDAELAKYKTFVSVYEYSKVRLEETEKELSKFKALYETEKIRIQELETMVANLQFALKNQEEMAREIEMFRFQNEKLRTDNTLFITRIQELESSLSVLSVKYKKLESIYFAIKGVAEHIGDVHEKLVETVEETERIENTLRSEPLVVFKSDIVQQTTQESTTMKQPEYGQRF